MGWWKADPEPEARPTPRTTSFTPSAPPPPQPGHTPRIAAETASSCPVDSKTRSIWLKQAQAQQKSSPCQPTTHPPHPVPIPQTAAETASSCPVDPQTRTVWLRQAQAQQKSSPPEPTAPSSRPTQPFSTDTFTTSASQQCSSDRISQSPTQPPPTSSALPSRPLSQSRQVSTIPRAQPPTPTHPSPIQSTTPTPANAEAETGPHSSGNWIYPSESQFFHAVMRKSTLTTSTPTDLAHSISSIIPIHNAVNERAWHLIKQWEGSTSQQCGGPKLLSFQGLGAGALSPKARWNTFWGYTEPFDRHDWVVQRCDGREVEYVIDFYQGKEEAGQRQGSLNFFLDVRPKINTWEGCWMRMEKVFGMR